MRNTLKTILSLLFVVAILLFITVLLTTKNEAPSNKNITNIMKINTETQTFLHRKGNGKLLTFSLLMDIPKIP